MRIVRDSLSHDKRPHAIPRVQTLIRSQTRTQDQKVDQKGQSIFFTVRFPPQFFSFPLSPRQFYYFPSSYSTSSFFIYFFSPPPPPHFYCSLLHQHHYHIYVAFTPPIVFLPDRPKRPTSGQNSQNQALKAKVRPKRPDSKNQYCW